MSTRGDRLLVAVGAFAVLLYVATYVGLLWLTHRAIERHDWADAAVAALIFIGLVSQASGSNRGRP